MKLVFFTLLISVFSLSVYAEPRVIQSPDHKVNILELYTSQGCSSCPPAEQWLNSLKTEEGLWTTFIPINFHVDYWDYIGWKDPFASASFSKRQRLYKHLKFARNVATPGFILNGKGWNGWFYGQSPSWVNESPSGDILATLNGKSIEVAFTPKPQGREHLQSGALKVHIAILGFDITTKVTGGENEGRDLSHDFVVLAHHSQPMITSEHEAMARMRLPDASGFNSQQQGIVIWVAGASDPRPIQAAGDWL